MPIGLGMANAKTSIASPADQTISGPEISIVPIASEQQEMKTTWRPETETYAVRDEVLGGRP